MNAIKKEQEKLDIIQWVLKLNDEVTIEKLKLLREKPKKIDWWEEITNEEKMAIEKGLDDIKHNRIKQHKEVKKIYEQWL